MDERTPLARRPPGAGPSLRGAGPPPSGGRWARLGVPLVVLAVELPLAADWAGVVSASGPAGAAALVAYTALGPLALIWRRTQPVVVFTVVCLWVVVAALFLHTLPVVALFFALFAVAVHARRRESLACLAATLVALGIHVARELTFVAPARRVPVLMVNLIGYLLLAPAAWVLGVLIGRREEQVADLEERQVATAREAVIAERLRLARELHDIVSHAVTIMVLQAAGARDQLGAADAAGPVPDDVLADVRAAMGHIEDKGKEAMAELRRLLSVMRDSGQVPHEPDASSGIADLPTLCESFTRAGLAVTMSVSGRPERLDPSVDLTAYRLAREALTNTAKHGGPGSAVTVDVSWQDDLVIDIRDHPARPGAGAAPLSTGTGLLGMQERVRALGGRLDIGERLDETGYQVRAVLPVSVARRS